MILDEQKKIKHVGWTIGIGFIASFAAFATSICFPPDFSTDPPTYPEIQLVFQEISVALYIFACTLQGLKLAEEKKTLPAGGFTMMAIAQGVYFVLFFLEFANPNQMIREGALIEAYKIFCGFMYLLIPAMVLISFYSDFPRWVNILGVVACIPNVFDYVLFMSTHKYSQTLDELNFISLILFSVTSLVWGILILRNMKREISNLNSKMN